ncbi:hypothetical protein BD626DRAFT_533816 [Schizophyllum amplum]|uniref:F-box domain-containing protein n=1 Tax=Schizophyllum amplum TaxID=97359 RepID=A0A550D0U4_9AGAR|nr:hypothetical protein BD626DRAFT_533816 [Auriculariopsis ampla]
MTSRVDRRGHATHWSFHALVRLLPESTATRADFGQCETHRNLTTVDLARVRFYGAYVREFNLDHYQGGISLHELTTTAARGSLQRLSRLPRYEDCIDQDTGGAWLQEFVASRATRPLSELRSRRCSLRSNMHAVLRTAELRDLIFSNIVVDLDVFAKKVGGSDAAALARTCRDFLEPALRVIWATQHSFQAFLQFLPEKTVTSDENRKDKLVGALTIDDLARVRYYWAFVREFYVDMTYAGLSSKDMEKVIVALDGEPIFPNLRVFNYCHRGLDGDGYCVPYFLAIIGPSTPEIVFGFESAAPAGDLGLEMSSLFALKRRQISTLYLDVVDNQSCKFENLLTGWTSLRYLHLRLRCPRAAPVLAAVSTLQGLHTLRLYAFTKIALGLPRVGPVNDTLRNLVINGCPDDGYAAAVITILHPVALTSLHVYADLAPEAIRTLCHRIRACCSADALKDISLSTWNYFAPRDGTRLVIQDILPLLAFTGLVSVSIHVFDIRFDDTDIARLAAAWPRLRTLSLRCTRDVVPACTLASLLSLAKACSEFEELALALDATELPVDQPVGHTTDRPPCRLRKLDVMRSPIGSEPERVASFLTRYFPSLKPQNVEAELEKEKEENWRPFSVVPRGVNQSLRYERWMTVKKLMPAFLDARKTGVYERGAARG